MRYVLKIAVICLCLAVLLFGVTLVADRQQLSDQVLRLHVVGASDGEEDQSVKLKVRDAVLGYIGENMGTQENAQAAKAWLQEHLNELELAANRALEENGAAMTASVQLGKEAFPKRDYETFSLPAGVYESLRITIGQGQGRNWWCVVFPSLCFVTEGELEDTAVGAGFSTSVTEAVSGQREIRFFLLDCLGWLQNWIFKG